MTYFDKFLRKYIFRIIGAFLAGGLNLLLLARAVFGGGEGPAFGMMLMDFPIVYFWENLIGRVGRGTGILLYLLGGTLIYALAGWLFGWIGDWLRQSSQETVS